jgi:hypothetical protein
LLGSAHQGLHVFGEAGAAITAAGPDELEANARVRANAIAAGFSRSELRTRSMSAPRRSARLASSFMNEILVASMALAAYLVSSAERTSITTMRSWLRLKGAYSAYGSTSSPDFVYIASIAAMLALPITMRSGFWKSAKAEPSLRNSGFETTSNGIFTPRACCSARMASATLAVVLIVRNRDQALPLSVPPRGLRLASGQVPQKPQSC